MMAETVWQTEHAARYMAQLCKHFAHKLPVTLNERDGQIRFSIGGCHLWAEPAGLRMRVSADAAGDLAQLQRVVGSHLQRFAFREMTEEQAAEMAWQPVTAP